MNFIEEKLGKQTKQTDSQDDNLIHKGFEQKLDIKSIIRSAIKSHEQKRIKKLQQQIQNKCPAILGKKQKFILTLILTLVMTIINSQYLFLSSAQQCPSPTHPLQPYSSTISQLQKHIQFIFSYTIFKYSIIYQVSIQQCEPMFNFIFKQSLCNTKHLDIKIKFIYHVGFKPNFEELKVIDLEKAVYNWNYGPLEILSLEVKDQPINQSASFFNPWSILQFKNLLNDKIDKIKPQAESKVKQFIDNNTTSDSNSTVQKLQNSIRKFLNKVSYNNNKKQKIPYIKNVMNNVNMAFNNVLTFFQITPIFKDIQEKQQVKDTFDEQQVIKFSNEEIFIGEEEFVENVGEKQVKLKENQKENGKNQENKENKQEKKQEKKQHVLENKPYDPKIAEQKLKQLEKKVSR